MLLVVLVTHTGCAAPVADSEVGPNTESRFPPGVDNRGISNASKLLEAHYTAVNRTGWRDTFTARYVGPENTDGPRGVISERSTLTAAAGMDPFSYRYRTKRTYPAKSANYGGIIWSNRSFHVSMEEPSSQPSTVTYCWGTTAYNAAIVTYLRGPPVRYLSPGDYSIVRINRTGHETLFTLKAMSAPPARSWNGTLTSFHSTVTFDSTGRIHHFEMNSTGRLPNGLPVTRSVNYRLVETGVTDV